MKNEKKVEVVILRDFDSDIGDMKAGQRKMIPASRAVAWTKLGHAAHSSAVDFYESKESEMELPEIGEVKPEEIENIEPSEIEPEPEPETKTSTGILVEPDPEHETEEKPVEEKPKKKKAKKSDKKPAKKERSYKSKKGA